MKKISFLILPLMVMALASCGSKDNSVDSTKPSVEDSVPESVETPSVEDSVPESVETPSVSTPQSVEISSPLEDDGSFAEFVALVKEAFEINVELPNAGPVENAEIVYDITGDYVYADLTILAEQYVAILEANDWVVLSGEGYYLAENDNIDLVIQLESDATYGDTIMVYEYPLGLDATSWAEIEDYAKELFGETIELPEPTTASSFVYYVYHIYGDANLFVDFSDFTVAEYVEVFEAEGWVVTTETDEDYGDYYIAVDPTETLEAQLFGEEGELEVIFYPYVDYQM